MNENDPDLTIEGELVGGIDDQHLLRLGHFVELLEANAIYLWRGSSFEQRN